MKEIVVNSLQDTKVLAERLTSLLPERACITLSGDLGVGKTTFAKALGKALGINKVMNSPTFTILKSYLLPSGNYLHHIDAYRLEGVHQDLGFEDLLEEGLCIIEWPQYLEDFLPDQYLMINIKIENEKRFFGFSSMGKKYDRIVEDL